MFSDLCSAEYVKNSNNRCKVNCFFIRFDIDAKLAYSVPINYLAVLSIVLFIGILQNDWSIDFETIAIMLRVAPEL
jgi:hypothetical protein